MTAQGTIVEDEGSAIFALAAELYPICRSITGDGVRETLAVLGRHVPIETTEVPTGDAVFDWTIPREWNIREAYIEHESGRRIVDMRNSNLHVMSYSAPVRTTMSLSELKPHIHTLPAQPDLIPYRTSYYAENWGFCMAHRDFEALSEGSYRVVIDSTLANGSLTYGEFFLRGEREDEILLSGHVCHPSLANDNCSGLALLTRLAQELSRRKTRYSYRFVFAPGTIGAIAWLARNETRVARITAGLVLSCVGDGGGPTYKRSRRGDAFVDDVMTHVVRHMAPSGSIIDFSPYGYDERQYCSPGFNLPVGLFQRSLFGTFPEYHTSADNLDFIKPEHLAESYRMIRAAIDVFEHNAAFVNLAPKCEPQLGRRGLYAGVGGDKDAPANNMAMLWVLNLSDGTHTLLDIAKRADMPFERIRLAAERLAANGLLAPKA